jgi:hypothetical protein
MIPLLTTCCCGIVSVRTASLLVAAMLIVSYLASDTHTVLFGCSITKGGRDSSVGLATRYALDGPRIES